MKNPSPALFPSSRRVTCSRSSSTAALPALTQAPGRRSNRRFSNLLFAVLMSGGLLGGAADAVRADQLATLDTPAVDIAVDGGAGDDDFTVRLQSKTGSPLPRPQVFPITGPARLVIDIPKITSKAAQTIEVSHPRVTAVRVGVHPDKTRVVLDLGGDAAPAFAVRRASEGEGYDIPVSFSGSVPPDGSGGESAESGAPDENDPFAGRADELFDDPPSEKAPTSRNAAGSQKAGTGQPERQPIIRGTADVIANRGADAQVSAPKAPAALDTGSADQALAARREEAVADDPFADLKAARGSKGGAVREVPDEPMFDEEPADLGNDSGPQDPAPDVIASRKAPPSTDLDGLGVGEQAPGRSSVRGIFYQMTSSKVPAVVFDVEGLSSYTLNKRKPDLYELVLENVKLSGKHLTLPQFPPDSFYGFNVIVAKDEGKNVVVKLYIEEGVKLFPFIQKQHLWLKASK